MPKLDRAFARIAVAALLSLPVVLAHAAVAAAPALLGPSVQAGGTLPASMANSAQVRIVRPQLGLVQQLAAARRSGAAPHFTLDFNDDANYDAEVTSTETAPSGAVSIAFRLPGVELSGGVVTVYQHVMLGDVRAPGLHYSIESLGDGQHVVREVTDDAQNQGLPPRLAPASRDTALADSVTPKDVPTDSGRLIDVMSLWDNAALAGYGKDDSAKMTTLAAQSVAQANIVYANSGIAQRLRLVYSGPVDYTQHGSVAVNDGLDFDAALDDVTNGTNGLGGVAALRNTHGADLVTLFFQRKDNICGLGWIPGSISSSNEWIGFNVVDAGCSVTFAAYPHELGHNMGADHDPYMPSSGAHATQYNRGYVSLPNRWRSIMAYDAQCTANGFNCSTILWMSSPSFTVDADGAGGKPPVVMGDASVSNVAMTLNRTAKATAGYRATSSLHPISAAFTDVPLGNSQFGAVEFMRQAQISAGCTGTAFCPDAPITRRQMAVFLERARKNAVYVPPAATGQFSDVPAMSQFAGFIEALKADGITTGCGGTSYCPDDPVSRAQMAIFLLRASCGPTYTPAVATGTMYADVSTATSGAAFIEKLSRLNVTTGCATSPARYCPADSLTRGQMAVFMERTFPFVSPSESCTP